MWLIQYLPQWIFSLLFFVGIAGFLVTKTVRILPYRELVLYTSIALVFLGTYMTGAKSNNDAWLEKVAILERQVLELKPKSDQANSVIDKSLVQQKQTNRDNTRTIIEYVNREVHSDCTLPDEAISAHNKAAK